MTRDEVVRLARDAALVIHAQRAADKIVASPFEHASAIADAVVAAVLPQVGTVEEVWALPLGTIVLGKQGTAWQFKRRMSVAGEHLSQWECDGVATSAAALLQTHGTLTVVWRP